MIQVLVQFWNKLIPWLGFNDVKETWNLHLKTLELDLYLIYHILKLL
jgi:hypothetical protein